MLRVMPIWHVFDDEGIHHATSFHPPPFHSDFPAGRHGDDCRLLRQAGTGSRAHPGAGGTTAPRASASTGTRTSSSASFCGRASCCACSARPVFRCHAHGRRKRCAGPSTGLCVRRQPRRQGQIHQVCARQPMQQLRAVPRQAGRRRWWLSAVPGQTSGSQRLVQCLGKERRLNLQEIALYPLFTKG